MMNTSREAFEDFATVLFTSDLSYSFFDKRNVRLLLANHVPAWNTDLTRCIGAVYIELAANELLNHLKESLYLI